MVYKLGEKIQKDKSMPMEMDPYPMEHPTRPGVSIALRSWGAASWSFKNLPDYIAEVMGNKRKCGKLPIVE